MSDGNGEPKGTETFDAPAPGEASETANPPPKVSPTMADTDNKPGKTIPGEPPIFDPPMMPVPAPAPTPVQPHFPARPALAAAVPPPPVYYPPPQPPRGGGGSNLGLIIGGLLGGAAVLGGGIALVFALKSPSSDDVKPIPLDNTAPKTEVKPDMPAGATTEDTPNTPPPAADPVPTKVATTTPRTNTKPKPGTQPTAQPTTQPTTQPTSQPTSTQPPLPPPPEPKSGGRTRPAKKKPD